MYTENYIQNPRNDGLRPGALGKVRDNLETSPSQLGANTGIIGTISRDCTELLLHMLVLCDTYHRRHCRRHILGKI